MDLLPTVLQGDAIAILVDWVLPLLGIVLFTAFMLWALAYASRYFEYLKAQESKWFGRDTLDFTRRFLFILWAVLFSVVVLLILQFRSEVARGVLQAVIAHVPAAFVVAFALFVGAVFVRVLRHFAEYLRGETRLRPGVPVAAPALALTELVLKYVIYAVAGVTAFVGGVQALPPQDQVVKDAVSALIRPEQWTSFLIIIAGAVLVGFVLDRIARSVFEDMKKRSKKFNARVLDQVKSASRVAVVLVVGTTALFLILNLVLDPLRLLVFAVGLIALALVVSLAAMGTLQEALAGLNLMMADPFDVGDRVKIGEDLVCDVVGLYLTMTQVRTLKGELVNLPNSRLREQPIVNFSRSKAYAMFVDVSVGFEIPHARVREILIEAARKTAGIVEDPPPEVYGKDLAGRAISYQLLAYTSDPARMKQIKSDLVFNIQDAFQRFGVVPGVRPE